MHVVPEGADGVTEGGTGDESKGGGFAFVAFRLAKKFNILEYEITRLLLMCVSLTMVATPFLKDMKGGIAKKLE